MQFFLSHDATFLSTWKIRGTSHRFRLVRLCWLCETKQVRQRNLFFVHCRRFVQKFSPLDQDGSTMRLYSSPSSIPTQTVRILIADKNRMGTQLLAESMGRDARFEIVSATDPAKILSIVTDQKPDL